MPETIGVTVDRPEVYDTQDNEAVMIYPGGFGVLNAQSCPSRMGTVVYAPHICATFYDLQHQVWVLAHFDPKTDLMESMSRIANCLIQGEGLSNLSGLRAIIDGGNKSSQNLKATLLKLFGEWHITNVVDHNSDLMQPSLISLVVDAAYRFPSYNVIPTYSEDPLLVLVEDRLRRDMRSPLSPDHINVYR